MEQQFFNNVSKKVGDDLRKTVVAIFRDSSFKSDSAKVNVTEIFKTISPSTTVKVV